jgi:transcriptional regulator with GAF, ATPase, and Fis domain
MAVPPDPTPTDGPREHPGPDAARLAAIDACPIPLVAIDRRGVISHANPAAVHAIRMAGAAGAPAATLAGTPLPGLIGNALVDAFDAAADADPWPSPPAIDFDLAAAHDHAQHEPTPPLAASRWRLVIGDVLDPPRSAAPRSTPPGDAPDTPITSHAPDGADQPRLCALIDRSEPLALRDELARLSERLRAAEAAHERRHAAERERLADAADEPQIIGRSPGLLRALDEADRVAPTEGAVLIVGETGAGKELLARRVHARSPRASRPMVEVNCAALPESLLESELFGHERGAFTGADRQRLGRFELADGGTLFLDEIGELSPAAQARLLRVLQDGSFQRVGGAETIRVDVRLIAATHRDLSSLVRRGRFREDLFYRLNVFTIASPALRDRREDVRPLAEHLHEKHAARMGRRPLPLSDRSMRKLMAYRWPGNVRELENVIERATILMNADHTELHIDLPSGEATTSTASTTANASHASVPPSGASASTRLDAAPARDVLLDLTADQLQRLHVMHALETSGWTVFGDAGAARKLGLNPQTLLSRMDKLGIPRPRKMRGKLSTSDS